MATSKYESGKVVSNCTKIWLCLFQKSQGIFYHLAKKISKAFARSSKQPGYKRIFKKLLSQLVYGQIWLNLLVDDTPMWQHHKIEKTRNTGDCTSLQDKTHLRKEDTPSIAYLLICISILISDLICFTCLTTTAYSSIQETLG